MDGDPYGDCQKPRHCRIDDRRLARSARHGCGRSAKAGTDAGRTGLGGFSHLGQDAARYLSERDFRSDRWGAPGWLARYGERRDLVAQRQTRGLPSWVRLGRRRRARQEQWSVRRGESNEGTGEDLTGDGGFKEETNMSELRYPNESR